MVVGSTDLMSAEHTPRFLVPFLRWLKQDIAPETIAQIQFLMRKTAHLSEYVILAVLLWRALRDGTNVGAKLPTLFVTAWFACAIFAIGDEFHQSFVPSRTASTFDVLIDICGALIGLAICSVIAWRRDRKSMSQN
jgi:VanZ family protein